MSCLIKDHKFEVMIDTGAEITLMSRGFYDNLKQVTAADFPTLPTPGLFIRGATGVKSKLVTFQVFVEIFFEQISFPTSVLVIPGVNVPFLLGIDFLGHFGAVVDCAGHRLSLLNSKVSIPWISFEGVQVNSMSLESDKPRVILIADSHGRGMKSYLNASLTDVSLEIYAFPGAPFNKVLEKLKSVSESLSPTDVVVVIAGTNNIASN